MTEDDRDAEIVKIAGDEAEALMRSFAMVAPPGFHGETERTTRRIVMASMLVVGKRVRQLYRKRRDD